MIALIELSALILALLTESSMARTGPPDLRKNGPVWSGLEK